MKETSRYPGYPPPAPTGTDPYRCESGTPAFRCGCATDFTGLIPALPGDEAELESYAQLYSYPGDILKKR